MATISNTKHDTIISGTNGDDSIKNSSGGEYCTINTGAGNDYVYNSNKYCIINTGEGNDSVSNWESGNYCTINTGAGNDYVYNRCGYCSITTGDGDDTVYFDGNDNFHWIITTGEGNDLISLNPNSWSGTINYISGDGNDEIRGFRSNDTLKISGSSYSTTKSGSDIIVAVDDGEILLRGYTSRSLNIDFEEINPSWTISGTTATYGIGTNAKITINGVKSLDGITLSGTTVTIANSALNQSNVTISDGYTLKLANDVTTPSTTAGSWNISGYTATYKSSATTAGYKLVNNAIIYTAASGGSNLVTVDGVISTDGLSLSGNTVTVANSSLNYSNVTISNGYNLALGNDVQKSSTAAGSWKLSGSTATYSKPSTTAGYSIDDNQIVYNNASGGGSFQVSGVKSTSGLTFDGNKTVTVSNASLNKSNVSISSGYTLKLGSDVTKTSTLAGSWNISGYTATYKSATTTAGYKLVNNAIIYTAASGGSNLVTVDGVISTDGLSLSGNTVTVANSSLNYSNVTISNGYNLALGNDVQKSSTAAGSWKLSGSTATYSKPSTTAGYSIDDNQIVYNNASGGGSFQVSGVKSTSGLSVSGNVVTVSNASLNQSAVSISDGYTLKLANDVTAPSTTAAGWSLNGTTATYKAAATSAGYSLANNKISYVTASGGNTLVTVNGVKSLDGLSLSGSTVTVSNASLNQSAVTISDGYTLKLANDVTAPSTTAGGWNISGYTATYKSSATTAGYKLVNNAIIYTAASGGNTLVTVSGVKSLDGISLNGSTVTVSNASLNQSNVSISDGYTLKLANDVTTSSTTAAGWSLNGTTATYKAAATSVGYSLANNKISYATASGGNALITVNGVKSLDGLSLSGSTVTVSNASLNQSNVTISDGYTLKLGSDVTKSTSTAAGWSLSGTTATYKSAKQTTGYKLAGNKISYVTASGGNTLLTVKGVKSTDGLKISGNVVTVSKSSLGTSKVTLTGTGYTLKLGDDVAKSATTKKSWSLSGTTATYKQTKSAYYILGSNGRSISQMKSMSSTLTTVKGVKSLDGLSVSGKVVTVSNASLNKKAVTISNGYTLKLGDDMTKSTSTSAKWTLSGTTATYKSAKKTTGYKLSSNKISYVTASGGKVLATVKGVKSKPTLSDGVITIKTSNISTAKKVSVNGSGYEFNFAAGNYNKSSITGTANADIITSNGTNLSINGAGGADTIKVLGTSTTVIGGKGNDSLVSNSSGGNVFVYNSGDGNDVITNFAATDKLSIKSAATYSVSGSDVVFSVGTGSITVKDAKDKKFTYYDSSGEKTYSGGKPYTISGKGVTLTSAYDDDEFDVSTVKSGSSIVTINAAKVTHDLDIVGNAKPNRITGTAQNDYINGSKGKDTILGGSGNDTIRGDLGNDSLKGGAGADVFIYYDGDGKDVIADYAAEDIIDISGSVIASTLRSDVVLKVGAGQITVKNAKEKNIGVTYFENGIEHDFINGKQAVTFEGNDQVRITARYWKDSFDVANFDNRRNIDGSAVTHDIEISGNKLANKIIGGSGKNTLIGGTGDDTLQGGDKADVFIYSKGDGKDIIYGYGADDTISIKSGAATAGIKGDTVILTVGNGKISLDGAVGKTVTYCDDNGYTSKIYSGNNDDMWFMDDENYIGADNQLSSIVQTQGAAFATNLVPGPSSLVPTNDSLPALTYSDKK